MTLLDAIADIFFPPACAACDTVLSAPGLFCDVCQEMLLETGDVICCKCGEPGRFKHDICHRCRVVPPPFACARAPYEHDGSIARAIHRFKYEDRPDLSRPLGFGLAEAAATLLQDVPGVLVPVPLHPLRFRERKFDHTTLLGMTLSEVTGRPLRESWLCRTRLTSRQVGLSEPEREVNVAGAFTVGEEVRGHSVVLLDDVFTTGATAREATRALLAGGAVQVFVLTLSRARRT